MPTIESTGQILLLWAAIGYLVGSVPWGMILARLMGLGNLRDIGSGNIGATNVLRTGSKTAAALTLLLDAGKGALVVLLARDLAAEDAAILAGLFALIGHCYPIWLRFAGGKGVATFLGLMLALAWPAGIVCCLAWLVGAAVTRISSMGAIVSAASAIFAVFFLGYPQLVIVSMMMTLLVFWRHRANIRRIKAGLEPKIGQKG